MNTQQIIVVVIVAVVAAILAWWYVRNQRRAHLRTRFGSEYERAVHETGNVDKAEAMLANRERRVDKLHIRSLTPEEADRFSIAWRNVQSRFVDDPKGAVVDADALITDVMATRGYPMTSWTQRVADISVDHPRVCEHYRVGHEIALRQERGTASTEDLRQAMVAYRELFAELVEPVHQQRRAG